MELVLVRWKGLELEESSWEGVAVMVGKFPAFSLEIKAVSTTNEIDSVADEGGFRVYSRRRKATAPVNNN